MTKINLLDSKIRQMSQKDLCLQHLSLFKFLPVRNILNVQIFFSFPWRIKKERKNKFTDSTFPFRYPKKSMLIPGKLLSKIGDTELFLLLLPFPMLYLSIWISTLIIPLKCFLQGDLMTLIMIFNFLSLAQTSSLF